jgi:hypothetical protein
MSWSVVGFVASLVPCAIALLVAADVICVPCLGMAAVWLKAAWGAAVAVAVVASTAGLHRRAGVGWAVAGLALGVLGGVLLALSEPALTGAVAIPTAAVVFAVARWR